MPRKLNAQLAMMGPCQELKFIPYAPCQFQDCSRVSTSSSRDKVPRETLALSLTHEAGTTLSLKPAPAAHHPDCRHAIGTSVFAVCQGYLSLCDPFELRPKRNQPLHLRGASRKRKKNQNKLVKLRRKNVGRTTAEKASLGDHRGLLPGCLT